jgi:glycosyltransferase involved in cell wall biosynthesis
MKILHVIASVRPEGGGPIEGIVQDSSAWSAGNSREIVSLDAPEDKAVAECRVHTYALGYGGPFYAKIRKFIPWLRYGYSPKFVKWLKANATNYDFVVVNGLWNYTARGSWRALHNSTVPYAVYTHGMLDPWFRETYPVKHFAKKLMWRFSEGRLLRDAAAVLFTTEEERNLARNAFLPYKLSENVVGYGTADVKGDKNAQIDAFKRVHSKTIGRQYLLFLGRLHKKKGCDLLIRAFAKFAQDHPGMDVVLAGPDQTGWGTELREIAQSLGVAERVHWTGMLKGDLKWGAFQGCSAFILPSHQENFGVVVAEAMACEKPVLITNKVNIWREVQDNNAGLVAGDTVEGVESLLKDFFALSDETRAKMGRNARLTFLQHFEIEHVTATLLALLQSLTVKSPRAFALNSGPETSVAKSKRSKIEN